jgi:hypothetical protein
MLIQSTFIGTPPVFCVDPVDWTLEFILQPLAIMALSKLAKHARSRFLNQCDLLPWSPTASVSQTPHSPHLKISRSGRPSVSGMMRVVCIDLPQLGQARRHAAAAPACRVNA